MRYIATIVLLLISTTISADWFMVTSDYGCVPLAMIKGNNRTPEEVKYKIELEGIPVEVFPFKEKVGPTYKGVKAKDISVLTYLGISAVYVKGMDQCKKLIPHVKEITKKQ